MQNKAHPFGAFGRCSVLVLQFRVREVPLSNQVPECGYPVLNCPDLVEVLIESQFFHQRGQQLLAVLCIVDGETLWITESCSFGPEDAREHRVESAHPEVAGLCQTHELANAFFHFPRRLVGEGECEDLKRIHSCAKQMSDAVGQHPRFA